MSATPCEKNSMSSPRLGGSCERQRKKAQPDSRGYRAWRDETPSGRVLSRYLRSLAIPAVGRELEFHLAPPDSRQSAFYVLRDLMALYSSMSTTCGGTPKPRRTNFLNRMIHLRDSDVHTGELGATRLHSTSTHTGAGVTVGPAGSLSRCRIRTERRFGHQPSWGGGVVHRAFGKRVEAPPSANVHALLGPCGTLQEEPP